MSKTPKSATSTQTRQIRRDNSQRTDERLQLNKPNKVNGGARPGAGMPVGHKAQKTLDKEAARAALAMSQ